MIEKDKLLDALLSFVEQEFMESDFIEFMKCNGYFAKETKQAIKHYANQNSFEKTEAGGENF